MNIEKATGKTFKKTPPVWHGQDKAAAIARAKEIGGYAIRSCAPGYCGREGTGPLGYWSDHNGMIRNWETMVWPK